MSASFTLHGPTPSFAPLPWSGQLALAPGIGVLLGQAGNNHTHHHWAHQIALGLDGAVQITTEQGPMRSAGLLVRAGTPHQLGVGRVLSVFLDPTTDVAHALCRRLPSDGAVVVLPAPLNHLFRDTLLGHLSLHTGLNLLQEALAPTAEPRADPRMAPIIAALVQREATDATLSRARLAALAGLSETRFSHWFRAQTGMPLRSYRKWLRLVRALEQALQGGRLTDAAHHATFADQAHFSRTFLQMFGVRASDVLAAIRLAPVPQSGLDMSRTRFSFFGAA